MAHRSKTPAAASTADRGDELRFGQPSDNSADNRRPQQIERLSITVRRHLSVESDVPAWVRIRNLDGVTVKLRPGPTTSMAEFDDLVVRAKLLLTGGKP